MEELRFLVVAGLEHPWVTPQALSLLEAAGTVERLDLAPLKDEGERRP